jgi:Zn-dependent protease
MGSQHDLIGLLFKVAVFFIPFLFSICIHEAAHAWMAKLCGDDTAEKMGRLTLNPLAHADPIGTILLPIAAVILPGNVSQFIFGWAKPDRIGGPSFKSNPGFHRRFRICACEQWQPGFWA